MKKKIKELFKYRKLPKILKPIPKGERQELLKGLINLQITIYKLDQYLEENWILKQSKLQLHWDYIYEEMRQLGYTRKKAFPIMSHIRRYQLHEQQLRENLSPSRLNKQYYYHYKSCDVRLIRRIINDRLSDDKNEIDDWRSFDLITEINDDVTDVFEDQHTINGNLFLITIMEIGINLAQKEFINLINEILEIDPFQSRAPNKLQLQIMKWTNQEAEATKKLIKKNCEILSQANSIQTKLWSFSK